MKTGKNKYYVLFLFNASLFITHLCKFFNPIPTSFFFRPLEPKLREC